MNLLFLDTSGPVAGVALSENGIIRYEAVTRNKMTHSQVILPMVEEAFQHSGISRAKIDLYAVTVGPGSFTGVRIGVSSVKGLSFTEGKKCVAVDALEATAAGLVGTDAVLCPIQDARAGQVYGAVFDGLTMRRLADDQPMYIEDFCGLAQKFNKRMIFLGDGTGVYKEKILSLLCDNDVAFAPEHMNYLRPASGAFTAFRHIPEAVDGHDLMPLYLRAPQAEKQKNLKEIPHE